MFRKSLEKMLKEYFFFKTEKTLKIQGFDHK